ncbi:MAG: c-type cytochrome domain-containing protein, partial [Roseimicrobium sp.]
MSRFHFRRLATLSWGLACTATAASAAPDFDKDVRPILSESCLECHSLDKAKGGLALVTREDVIKTLKSGVPALIPGKPAESEIIKRVATTHD